jgi:hypothetical protein
VTSSDATLAVMAPRARLGMYRLVQLGLMAVFFVYVLNAWTPSHYGQAARLLGVADAGPVFGESRGIRTDDWAVAIPYFQLAVANNLGPVDNISPFKEPLKAYFALPSRDWSMAFKPDLWGFLVFDPAHALSLHYAILAAAMLAGFAILLRQFGCAQGIALAGSAMLLLSQFVQVWWTSSAALFAWTPWPVVIFLWRGPWYLRLPGITYAVAVWLIGNMYPGCIIAAGLAFAILIAAFRPTALSPARLVPGLAAAIVGAGVAWLHFGDLIPVMAHTVYPGQRISDGGGLPGFQFLAQAFPYLVSANLEPLGLWKTNACEVAVVGSFLPLCMATFADYGVLRVWAGANRRAIYIWAIGIELLAAWTLFPIPGRYVPILNIVPGYRMIWGVGLVFLLGIIVAANDVKWILRKTRVWIFISLVTTSWIISKVIISHTLLYDGYFDLVVLIVLLSLLIARRIAPHIFTSRRVVLTTVVVTAAVTFGQFNPVQSARPIFERHTSPLLESLRAYAAANPKGVAIVSGWYGATINGAGVPAINHVLLRPELELFRRAYPDLEPGAFNEVFNRYEHLTPRVQWAPSVLRDDGVAVPPDPFAIPLTVEIAENSEPAASAGTVEAIKAVKLGDRRWGVTATGWAPWRGVADSQRLRVAVAPALGRIISASAFRLPRPDLVQLRNDPTAFAPGFGVRLQIETAAALQRFPTEGVSIIPIDLSRVPAR